MKKTILSLIVAIVGTLGSFAQDDLVATLSHGSDLNTFSGEDALAQAYEAAADGDIITLSPGVFVGVNMDKAITLRGTGYKPMASNGYMSTQIAGDMTINIPADATSTFEMEGLDMLGSVSINGNKLVPIILHKNRFRQGVTGLGISMKAFSCLFASLKASCYIDYYTYENTTLNCFNCVIMDINSAGLSNNTKMGKIIATNCVVQAGYSAHYCVFRNCIIIGDEEHGTYEAPLPETCFASYCVGIDRGRDIFENIINPTNMMAEGSNESAFANVFKTLKDVSFSLYETFELTDAAAAQYLGEDGTQVGVYGGTNPFDPTPSIPMIRKLELNSKAEGGKLNVKINVE